MKLRKSSPTTKHHHLNYIIIIIMPIRISLTVDPPEAASVITAAASTVTGVTNYESQALPPEANPAGRPAKVDNDIKYLKKFEDLTLCDILDELRPLIRQRLR